MVKCSNFFFRNLSTSLDAKYPPDVRLAEERFVRQMQESNIAKPTICREWLLRNPGGGDHIIRI